MHRLVIFAAIAALGFMSASATAASGASGGAADPACTEFRATDSVSGRISKVCLTVGARAPASPRVWCRAGKCLVAGPRTPNPGKALGNFSAADIGKPASGDDVCIEYKFMHSFGSGTICLAADLSAGDLVCGIEGGGENCIIIVE